jgi:hypothetical protein
LEFNLGSRHCHIGCTYQIACRFEQRSAFYELAYYLIKIIRIFISYQLRYDLELTIFKRYFFYRSFFFLKNLIRFTKILTKITHMRLCVGFIWRKENHNIKLVVVLFLFASVLESNHWQGLYSMIKYFWGKILTKQMYIDCCKM